MSEKEKTTDLSDRPTTIRAEQITQLLESTRASQETIRVSQETIPTAHETAQQSESILKASQSLIGQLTEEGNPHFVSSEEPGTINPRSLALKLKMCDTRINTIDSEMVVLRKERRVLEKRAGEIRDILEETDYCIADDDYLDSV